MSRYIDADALKKAMYHEAFETDSDMQKWDSGCWIRYKMFENKIAEQPTVDAVEIVRCKDCKRKNVIPDMYGIGTEALYCRAIERYVEHDFFCKYGEKVTE